VSTLRNRFLNINEGMETHNSIFLAQIALKSHSNLLVKIDPTRKTTALRESLVYVAYQHDLSEDRGRIRAYTCEYGVGVLWLLMRYSRSSRNSSWRW
jgi:hypothetical protein